LFSPCFDAFFFFFFFFEVAPPPIIFMLNLCLSHTFIETEFMSHDVYARVYVWHKRLHKLIFMYVVYVGCERFYFWASSTIPYLAQFHAWPL
jgi:hypothetical protein